MKGTWAQQFVTVTCGEPVEFLWNYDDGILTGYGVWVRRPLATEPNLYSVDPAWPGAGQLTCMKDHKQCKVVVRETS